MAFTRRTVLRNTGVITQGREQGKTVSFRYTDASGVASKRTVKVLHAEATRHNTDALVIKAQDGLSIRSFRTDRMSHAKLNG